MTTHNIMANSCAAQQVIQQVINIIINRHDDSITIVFNCNQYYSYYYVVLSFYQLYRYLRTIVSIYCSQAQL